ncbi:arsinothricin resistance N-acetyltransferase ArsN1 family B [Sphingomonas dokdonensis]|uniref:Phosphinothricin N-acetyltransferase n=1 Tax=Sphingomonas dokdonensis TaxID=344880 RepID=A0A245ZMY3_9SPHN|nr:arsinothricin resistance N-acetyltransferase ArsN1 family B [Sphingomonas dokdonensis]OWK31100.1 phosphinothricin N-acetyltransferase [Sphingomonas dokdonensis]
MIALRAAVPADAATIAAIYAPHVLAGTVSFETAAPDEAQMRDRMTASAGLYPWLVATAGAGDEAAVIGYAYATRFRERAAYRWVVETSIYLADAAQRQGVGRSLYGALIATLRTQGFTQAMGVIALPNEPSVALHEAVGFRRAGHFREVGYKHGQWVDVGYWQRPLADSVVSPAEPRRFADVGIVLP